MRLILILFLILTVNITSAQTVKKVVIEKFSGGWCQTCPNGSKAVEDMVATHGEKLIPIAVHNKDGFDIPDGDSVDIAFDVDTYPAAAIDREKYSGKYSVTTGPTGSSWKTKVSSKLSAAAIASVGFDNLKQVNDSTYEGDVVIKFTSAAVSNMPISVNVCVIESKIEARKYLGTKWGNIDIAQKNSTNHYGHDGSGWTYTTTASSGNTFYYQNVLRTILGGPWGWTSVVPNNPTVGKEYTKHFSFTVSSVDGFPIPWKRENMEVVGYVSYNGSLTGDEKEILNAEKIKMDAFVSSGIEEKHTAVNVMSTYPNPATVNDIINIQFNIHKSDHVVMNVYDVTGKLITTPYSSDDVTGAHTIMWRPSKDDVKAGVYFIELITSKEKTTKKLILQ